MRAHIVIGALTVLAMFALVYRANTQDRTYAGFNCTVDCSSYEAGYKWAEQYGIDDEDYCANSNQSFYEGCVAYVQEPGRAANEADNGIGTPMPLNPNDDDDDDNN